MAKILIPRRIHVRGRWEDVPIVVKRIDSETGAADVDAWVSRVQDLDAYLARRERTYADARTAVTRAMTSTGVRKITY